MAVNISDFLVGLYLLSIAVTDIVVGDTYVESVMEEKYSMLCIGCYVSFGHTNVSFFHVGCEHI